jgi:hypothetical protein
VTLRIATYNVEWFVNLFDRRGRLLEDRHPSARYGVTRGEQAAALGRVFRAMDADAVMVIEAPDTGAHRTTTGMLEAFAARFRLRARKAAMGFANDTQQEIAILYDPDRMTAGHDPKGPPGDGTGGGAHRRHEGHLRHAAPRFDTVNRLDLDIDGREDILRFNKPPFEVSVRTTGGMDLRLIGVHMKSKAPHDAENPAEAKRLGIAARREQLAQCLWLRQRVLEHLAAGDSLIVMGDFNDGPGLDEYEKLFGRSSVEIVMGWDEPHGTRLFDPHARAALGKRLAAAPATARFYLPEKGQFFSALLDYMMVSPDIRATGPRWRIWHPFDDPACFGDRTLCDALLAASDHFPVSIDIDEARAAAGADGDARRQGAAA